MGIISWSEERGQLREPPSATNRLTIVRLEWYEDMDCACDDRYDLDAEPRVCTPLVLPGVLGTASVRELRAVSGVGALMSDFFGVSVTLVLRLPRFDDADCSRAFAVLLGVAGTFVRRPADMYGCRKAACGFIRRSGSHMRHLEMKSTKSSSEGFLSACASVLVPGRRLLPFEFTTGLGLPEVSTI